MSDTKILKELLISAYQKEQGLIELVIDCMQDIFMDDFDLIESFVNHDLSDGMDINGCLQSVQYYHNIVEKARNYTDKARDTFKEEGDNDIAG